MTHLLVRVWRRKGAKAKWERVTDSMSVYDGVQMEAESNQAATTEQSGWQYATFPAGDDPNAG